MKKVAIFLFVCLIFSCAKPTQPELSTKEKVFFNELEKQCDCSIQREIDTMLLRIFSKSEHAGYFVTLSIPCNKLKKDSLEKYSNVIAKVLYFTILDKDLKFNKITVEFECPTGANEFQSKYFEYDTEKWRK